MKITVTGHGVQVLDAVREYAEQKAAKLERYNDQLQKIEIVISAQGDEKAVEMIAVPRRGAQIVGHSQHEDAYAAIDMATDKMAHQIRKLKEKRMDKRKRSGRMPAPPLPSDEVEEEKLGTYQDAVEEFSENLES